MQGGRAAGHAALAAAARHAGRRPKHHSLHALDGKPHDGERRHACGRAETRAPIRLSIAASAARRPRSDHAMPLRCGRRRPARWRVASAPWTSRAPAGDHAFRRRPRAELSAVPACVPAPACLRLSVRAVSRGVQVLAGGAMGGQPGGRGGQRQELADPADPDVARLLPVDTGAQGGRVPIPAPRLPPEWHHEGGGVAGGTEQPRRGAGACCRALTTKFGVAEKRLCLLRGACPGPAHAARAPLCPVAPAPAPAPSAAAVPMPMSPRSTPHSHG